MKKPSSQLFSKAFQAFNPHSRGIGINLIFTFLLLCLQSHMLQAQSPVNYFTSPTHIGGYHIKCNGESTGVLEVTPAFGTAPYTILWNTGETVAKLVNKPAGIYIVTVTDNNNTSRTDTFELRQPYPLNHQANFSDYAGFNISKYGENNGFIQLNPSGGTPPYRYTWSNGDSIANPRNLVAGNYSFVITDANQCTSSGNLSLTQPNNLQVSFTNVVNPTCNKNYDGKATIEITGGLGDFSVV
jgi:hypothetical protein